MSAPLLHTHPPLAPRDDESVTPAGRVRPIAQRANEPADVDPYDGTDMHAAEIAANSAATRTAAAAPPAAAHFATPSLYPFALTYP